MGIVIVSDCVFRYTVDLVRGGGGHLQVEAEAGVRPNERDQRKQPQHKHHRQHHHQQQQQQQHQQQPVFLSSRDVVPKGGGGKVGGSARDVRGSYTEQVEVGWQQQQQQQQQHGIHVLRASVAADGDVPPRARSKVEFIYYSKPHHFEKNHQPA